MRVGAQAVRFDGDQAVPGEERGPGGLARRRSGRDGARGRGAADDRADQEARDGRLDDGKDDTDSHTTPLFGTRVRGASYRRRGGHAGAFEAGSIAMGRCRGHAHAQVAMSRVRNPPRGGSGARRPPLAPACRARDPLEKGQKEAKRGALPPRYPPGTPRKGAKSVSRRDKRQHEMRHILPILTTSGGARGVFPRTTVPWNKQFTWRGLYTALYKPRPPRCGRVGGRARRGARAEGGLTPPGWRPRGRPPWLPAPRPRAPRAPCPP